MDADRQHDSSCSCQVPVRRKNCISRFRHETFECSRPKDTRWMRGQRALSLIPSQSYPVLLPADGRANATHPSLPCQLNAIIRSSHHRIELNGCGFTEATLYVEQSHTYIIVGERGHMAYRCPYAEATFNQSDARVQPCPPTGISQVRTSRTTKQYTYLLGVSASSLNLGGAQQD